MRYLTESGRNHWQGHKSGRNRILGFSSRVMIAQGFRKKILASSGFIEVSSLEREFVMYISSISKFHMSHQLTCLHINYRNVSTKYE